MWFEVEPGEMLMFRIGLVFALNLPDPEDNWVRDYLAEKELEPRRILHEDRGGEPIEILQFGQCYLGPHAQALRDLHWRGIERSALQEALPGILAAPYEALAESGLTADSEAGRAVLAAVAERVHPETQFAAGEEGRIGVKVDPDLALHALDVVLAERGISRRDGKAGAAG